MKTKTAIPDADTETDADADVTESEGAIGYHPLFFVALQFQI